MLLANCSKGGSSNLSTCFRIPPIMFALCEYDSPCPKVQKLLFSPNTFVGTTQNELLDYSKLKHQIHCIQKIRPIEPMNLAHELSGLSGFVKLERRASRCHQICFRWQVRSRCALEENRLMNPPNSESPHPWMELEPRATILRGNIFHSQCGT